MNVMNRKENRIFKMIFTLHFQLEADQIQSELKQNFKIFLWTWSDPSGSARYRAALIGSPPSTDNCIETLIDWLSHKTNTSLSFGTQALTERDTASSGAVTLELSRSAACQIISGSTSPKSRWIKQNVRSQSCFFLRFSTIETLDSFGEPGLASPDLG